MLSVILSLVGGIKDVPNLLLFGATNRKESMDPAFLRRIDIKLFVGKPSYEYDNQLHQRFYV
jgi:SpoVK/Ycf46/Vps4 family AAA+-type ATPase